MTVKLSQDGVFINQVNAQTGKAFTQEEADLLILLAQALR